MNDNEKINEYKNKSIEEISSLKDEYILGIIDKLQKEDKLLKNKISSYEYLIYRIYMRLPLSNTYREMLVKIIERYGNK